MMCECRAKIDELLRERNGRLAAAFTWTDRTLDLSPPLISTERINSRKKPPPLVFATFCPFCGEKWPKADDAETPDQPEAA